MNTLQARTTKIKQSYICYLNTTLRAAREVLSNIHEYTGKQDDEFVLRLPTHSVITTPG